MATEAPNLPFARDLKSELGEAMRQRVPVLILFSLPACPYCNEIRRSHLLPMMADPVQSRRAIVRQVDLKGPTPMLDWKGRKTTHGDFARGNEIGFAPVVAFHGAGGTALGEPLIGGMLPDFYAHYLESALEAAIRLVRQRK